MFATIMIYIDYITIIFAFFAMLASCHNFFQRKKDMKNIKIYVLKNGTKSELPVILLRKHFTRAELFGILGALHKGDKFYIGYTAKIEIMQDIIDIQNAKKDELIIELTDKDKFEWN